MKVGIFTGTIVLDKNHFDVRQLYVTERLKHLINYNDLNITVICPSGISEELKDLDCNYIYYKMSRRRYFGFGCKVVTALIPSFLKLLKIDCDILHVYSNELAMFAIIAQKVRRKKFKILFEPMGLAEEEITIHMKSSWKAKMLKTFTVWREEWIIRNSSGIVVYTDAMKLNYSEKYNISKKNIFVVPYGYDHMNLDIDPREVISLKKELNVQYKKIIVYAGYVSELHGSLMLVKAMKILQDHNASIILILAGDGPLLPEVKKFVKKERLKNIIIKGFVPSNDIPLYLKVADILVIPHVKSIKTDVDAPTKLFEYLAIEKPIVAFDLKAIAEIVGDHAVLVEPDSPQALAEGILKVLEDEKLAKKLGKGGKKIADNYSWEESAKNAYEAYKESYNYKSR